MDEYEVYEYEVWGNEKDGYLVNNRFLLLNLELAPNATNRQIMKALKKAGALKNSTHLHSLNFDGDDESVYIESNNGFPLFELHKKTEEEK